MLIKYKIIFLILEINLENIFNPKIKKNINVYFRLKHNNYLLKFLIIFKYLWFKPENKF